MKRNILMLVVVSALLAGTHSIFANGKGIKDAFSSDSESKKDQI